MAEFPIDACIETTTSILAGLGLQRRYAGGVPRRDMTEEDIRKLIIAAYTNGWAAHVRADKHAEVVGQDNDG